MAGPGLPTGIVAGGTGHVAHSNAVHGIANAFDTGLKTATSGQVLKWNGTVYAPAADAIGSGGTAGEEGLQNVKDYGAVGNGSTNDTTAIETAFAVNGTIFLPAGNYLYTGNGLFNGGGLTIQGAGMDKTRISLGASKVLVAGSAQINNLLLRDFTTDGGAGGINLTYTGVNVIEHYLVENVYFYNYTGTAIGHTASDMPYWKIIRCGFRSANNTTSIGIALGGLTDLNEVIGCWFLNNRIHIKIGDGGNNMKVENCDLIQFNTMTTSNPRASIWIVPKTANVNAGQGFVARSNKFGNENLNAADYRILYANAVAGSFLTALPTTAADSTGYVAGHIISDNLINGGNPTGTNQPFVYTTTPNVIGCEFGPNTFAGTAPNYVLQYRTAVTGSGDNARNWFGPNRASLYDLFADGMTAMTNSTTVGFVRGDRTSVTGSKGGNAALTSVIAALVKHGIVVDNTS